mmetsp:Transcript_69981/g.195279  ORF Transcript_69981/g.195279 Transcript_69981/m.195279 type:complete len:233 (-) Transcript_69981:116-814(-)
MPGMPGMPPRPAAPGGTMPPGPRPAVGGGFGAPSPHGGFGGASPQGGGVMAPGYAAAPAQAQAPAATGPPAYGKASTAPTASAAPVIEGMPTPWPLPSSTQQLGSTTKSVAAANKAVQQGSLGSGQVPLGDPMPAHELSHVQGVLSMLLEASAQDGNAKKREDIAKRLEILYSRLSSGQMKNSTSQKVLQLVKAIEAQDYATAGRLQADLSSNDWEANREWITGLKRLVPQR